jgi:hypothetical protein
VYVSSSSTVAGRLMRLGGGGGGIRAFSELRLVSAREGSEEAISVGGCRWLPSGNWDDWSVVFVHACGE